MGSFVNEHALVSFLGFVSFLLLHVFLDSFAEFFLPSMVCLSAVLASSRLVVNVADDSINHREELTLVHLAVVGILFENLFDAFFILLIQVFFET